MRHTFEPLHTQIKVLDQYRRPINSNERKERIAKASMKYPYYGATGQAGEIDEYLLDYSEKLEDTVKNLKDEGKEFNQHEGYIRILNHKRNFVIVVVLLLTIIIDL